MNRILFQINYDVYPEKRDEYIATMKELETYLKDNRNHNYLVVEDKIRKYNFTEIYICNDEAEFEEILTPDQLEQMTQMRPPLREGGPSRIGGPGGPPARMEGAGASD